MNNTTFNVTRDIAFFMHKTKQSSASSHPTRGICGTDYREHYQLKSMLANKDFPIWRHDFNMASQSTASQPNTTFKNFVFSMKYI